MPSEEDLTRESIIKHNPAAAIRPDRIYLEDGSCQPVACLSCSRGYVGNFYFPGKIFSCTRLSVNNQCKGTFDSAAYRYFKLSKIEPVPCKCESGFICPRHTKEIEEIVKKANNS